MRGGRCLILITFLLLAGSGCRDPFEPNVADTDLQYLVVEGFIETNAIETKIRLSRTSPIGSTTDIRAEIGANLRLIADSGEIWPFSEGLPGDYHLTATLDNQQQYQLEINLRDGSKYLSKSLKPIVSPAIDEVGFYRDEFGVEIYLSTQGTMDAAYFLWQYEEDWIFWPGVTSFLKFENGVVSTRSEDERIDRCWMSTVDPKIVLQNAARFENNTILQRELVRIPILSEKLTKRYSINVKQWALDQEAYDFWEILRKNSDDIGGIFSPLPSFMPSNIIPLEGTSVKAIGHVGMGQSASKRIYINNADVQPWRVFIPEYEYCIIFPDTIPPSEVHLAFNNIDRVPAREIWEGMFLIGYHAATKECTDCTMRGNGKAPAFWED